MPALLPRPFMQSRARGAHVNDRPARCPLATIRRGARVTANAKQMHLDRFESRRCIAISDEARARLATMRGRLLLEVGVVGAFIASCGGRTTEGTGGAGGTGGSAGARSADAASDSSSDAASDAGSAGERAIAEFESALRTMCKCANNTNPSCYDWATRFNGYDRACYVSALDRHAAEGLATCFYATAKTISDCLQSCSAQCDTASLDDDTPMSDVFFDRCQPAPRYLEEIKACSRP